MWAQAHRGTQGAQGSSPCHRPRPAHSQGSRGAVSCLHQASRRQARGRSVGRGTPAPLHTCVFPGCQCSCLTMISKPGKEKTTRAAGGTGPCVLSATRRQAAGAAHARPSPRLALDRSFQSEKPAGLWNSRARPSSRRCEASGLKTRGQQTSPEHQNHLPASRGGRPL